MVEKDVSDILDSNREQMRVLRGVALDTEAYSYVDRFQQLAEVESQMKV